MVIDEINFLKTRPIINSEETNRGNETDWSKSVDHSKTCNGLESIESNRN